MMRGRRAEKPRRVTRGLCDDCQMARGRSDADDRFRQMRGKRFLRDISPESARCGASRHASRRRCRAPFVEKTPADGHSLPYASTTPRGYALTEPRSRALMSGHQRQHHARKRDAAPLPRWFHLSRCCRRALPPGRLRLRFFSETRELARAAMISVR